MITGLESLSNLQTPLNTVLENLADTIADKVIAKIKAEESNKPKYYTRKELCEILHVTNPTVIEMVKRGEIREKKMPIYRRERQTGINRIWIEKH